MIRVIANNTVRFCDWMMGYHGSLIYQAVYASAITGITTAGIIAMFLATC